MMGNTKAYVNRYNDNGIERVYDYDKNHRLIKYSDSEGNSSERDYNEKGDLIYIKNSNGYEAFYDYETPLEIIKLIDANGVKNIFIYDHKYSSVIREINGHIVINTYDDRNRLIYHKDPYTRYGKRYSENGDEYIITYSKKQEVI